MQFIALFFLSRIEQQRCLRHRMEEMLPESAIQNHADVAPRRSRFGLNAANFFQAEAVGVILPVLNSFLRDAHWRYDQIGIATALAGLGTLLFQTPAGLLAHRFARPRLLFFLASIAVGLCFGAIPLLPRSSLRHAQLSIDALLFLSGVAQSLFAPVLGALALAVVGYGALNRTLGTTQGWNHVGNVVAALFAFFAVRRFGAGSIFYSVAAASLVGAASVYWIRRADLHRERLVGSSSDKERSSWRALLRDQAAFVLLVAVALFHLANAPILPVTALYIKHLGGSNQLTTFTVLSAQIVMIPVALATGRLCDSWGAKAIMAVAFWVLPFRILSYIPAHTPPGVVILQSLDGIGAGIYSVAIVAFAAALTRRNGQFTTLLGLFATAQGIGGVVGPVLSGLLLEHLGFTPTFLFFAALALLAAILFQSKVRPIGHSG